jgi:hypothetical protein
MFDRERTRKPRLVGGVRGSILKEYTIRFAHESSIDSPSAHESSIDSPSAHESSIDSPSAHESSIDSPSAHESSISLPGSPALWAGSFTLVKWEMSQTGTHRNPFKRTQYAITADLTIGSGQRPVRGTNPILYFRR